MTGQQLVEYGTKPINIRCDGKSRVITGSLFRCHVTGRAQYLRCALPCSLLDEPRQSKVGQVRFALSINQDIPGPDVTMKDAVLVRVMNRASYLDD